MIGTLGSPNPADSLGCRCLCARGDQHKQLPCRIVLHHRCGAVPGGCHRAWPARRWQGIHCSPAPRLRQVGEHQHGRVQRRGVGRGRPRLHADLRRSRCARLPLCCALFGRADPRPSSAAMRGHGLLRPSPMCPAIAGSMAPATANCEIAHRSPLPSAPAFHAPFLSA
jgi:hypothetical protein